MINTYRLEEQFNSADLDIKDGLFEAAVHKLEAIIEEEPHFGKAYNHLGWLHETKFKNLNQAEQYYKLAVEYAPMYPAAYINSAILYSNLEKYEELKTILEKALTVPGVEKAAIYREYGIMHEKLGNYNEAIEYYKKSGKATLAQNTLKNAMDSIERCKTKMRL